MSSQEIEFLLYDVVVEMHDSLIEKYGGLPGIRDEGLLLSGLSRVEFYHYYENFEVPALAAVYLFSINTGHLFVDGNKRTSIAAAESFLSLNGYMLDADSDDLEKILLNVANSRMTLEVLCEFISKRCTRIPSDVGE